MEGACFSQSPFGHNCNGTLTNTEPSHALQGSVQQMPPEKCAVINVPVFSVLLGKVQMLWTPGAEQGQNAVLSQRQEAGSFQDNLD